MEPWTTNDSAELYGIEHWGRDFLRIAPNGNLLLAPQERGRGLDLKALVDDLQRRGIDLPILVRFPDMVADRVKLVNEAFTQAMAGADYQGAYRGVFPIKVNQNHHLVESLLEAGRPFHLGLEAGSKPELLLVIAQVDDPEALIVCNGYKDVEYIEIALFSQLLGRRPILVIEKASEIPLILETSRRLGIRPVLGMRAKLSSRGSGRWEASAGDRAKFGLTVAEIVDGMKLLADSDMLDCLQLLHFHIGSQVSAIRAFKVALGEASRIFVEMHKMGAPMRYLDVGGGLGVDYDGSKTNFASSMNYSVSEYAEDVVCAGQSACDTAGVPHPTLVTESGRALVAHHAMLVVNVLGVGEVGGAGSAQPPADEAPDVLHELHDALGRITQKHYQSAWHDAVAARRELLSRFTLGLLTLEQRAHGERLFWQVARAVARLLPQLPYVPDDFEKLPRTLADTYFCNFSIFQSLPDSWAVDQLFPIVPIHRLHERPTRTAVLADITCDSDGKVDRFIDLHDVRHTLPLHAMDDEPYTLGVFLVGAYQEILGDLHNLFGDTNAVVVRADGDGSYDLEAVTQGDTVEDVLSYVQFDRRTLTHQMRRACERAIRKRTLKMEDAAKVMAMYQAGMEGYTYLE